jgi:diguanylate cyclase (GGDEF)-like protein/PAS domain S-box-containing protein
VHREKLERLVEERTAELTALNELLRAELDDRARTLEDMRRSAGFLNAVIDGIHDPFSIVDRDYRIMKFNDAYARMHCRTADELLGKRCHEALRGSDRVCSGCVIDKTFQSRDPCAKEKMLTLPDGSRAWVEIYTYPIFDRCGNVSHVVEYCRDITERKRREEEERRIIRNLSHLSITDTLTGLLNRRGLNDILRHEIERAGRYHADLSLILCDVDRLKAINDTFGHAAGDLALQTVAEALRSSLRKADVLGRYGGDEFMVILPETSTSGAWSLAEKIRVAVQELDIDLPGNNRVRLSLSLGVAGCRTTADNIDAIVSLADTALYASKQEGRNKVSVIKP